MNNFTSILFCTDFSSGAANALKYAVKAALRNRAHLYILHVVPEADAQFWRGYLDGDNQASPDSGAAELRAKLRAEYAASIPLEVNWEPVVDAGPAPDRIVSFVREKDISLVVLGRPRPRFLRSLLFGSVASKVARTVTCPMLIVPEA
ncbi:MAG: universal stress protein [Kiritimatiellae bacterium]|jgi:nucleotide-binding universal stress UspA family protein|nr:universal stress protein [Kiritimatiellia bacterium]MBR4611336.1 universal stress protein [Kiritimatiellia bacterium]